MDQKSSLVAGAEIGAPFTASDSWSARLSFDRPVSRHSVHRASMAEVFVSDAFPINESHCVVAAQWPRDHVLYSPGASGQTDALLFAETFRQTMVFLAHEFHGVPLTHHFVGRRLEFEITDPRPLTVGPAPLAVVLDTRWSSTGGRPPGRYEFRVDAQLLVADVCAGRAALDVIALDARRYSMLRHRPAGTPAPVPAAVPVPAPAVGRQRARDSVLRHGPEPGQWWLAADPAHAVLFDHPTDHLPLMVLAEGFRQLGYLLQQSGPSTTPALSAMTIDCHAFAELDEPVGLTVRAHESTESTPGHRLRVDAAQGGRPVAGCDMRWRSVSAVVSGAEHRPRFAMSAAGHRD